MIAFILLKNILREINFSLLPKTKKSNPAFEKGESLPQHGCIGNEFFLKPEYRRLGFFLSKQIEECGKRQVIPG
jgi:hypothetical protein